MDMKLPQVGEEREVEIVSIAYGGEGIVRIEGFVFFVPDVITGEKVRMRVTEIKRSFGKGEALQIIEASPHRVEPPCPVYGQCGGCQYQHIQYEETLRIKENQLKETLGRIGGIQEESLFQRIIPSPQPYGYRSSITLKAKQVSDGFQLGYVARDNKSFIPILGCPIASPKINQNLKSISESLPDQELSALIREITVKEGKGKVLFYPHYRKPYQFKTKDRLFFDFQGLSVGYGLNSFFQINQGLIPKIIRILREYLSPRPGEKLFDLYAGSGIFSLGLANDFYQVIALEESKEAVRCFQENIQQNGIKNVVACRGKVEERLKPLFEEHKGKLQSVLLDPPREGLQSAVIPTLKNLDFRKMIYISCEPSTLARDLKLLKEIYSLKKIFPLDMFPQTKHIETIVLLERAL